MSEHQHSFGDDWPFDCSENLAVYTTRQVMREGLPLFNVFHDEEGDWQFLCGTTNDPDDLMIVCFGCMVEKFPEICQFAGLEPGWRACKYDDEGDWLVEHAKLDMLEAEYPFPRLGVDGYDLLVVEQYDLEEGELDLPDFPTDQERFAVTEGDLVKLIFRYAEAAEVDGQPCSRERMWVKCSEVREGHFIGFLNNTPRATRLIDEGAKIVFHPKHIVKIYRD